MTADTDTILLMVRDEFSRLHNRLVRFDTSFAEHVAKDDETRALAIQTKESIEYTRRTFYILWGIIISILTLTVAWFRR